MDRLKSLFILLKVSESGSFSSSAKELGIGQPAVSRAVESFEQELGVKIFHRSTRKLSLTDEGRKIIAEARKVTESYEQLLFVSQLKSEHQGLVRVTCPNALGTVYLIPAVLRFNKLYPQIAIQLRITDSYLNFYENEIDVALRVGELKSSQMIAKYIGNLQRIAVASDLYIRTAGVPNSVSELADHNCIIVNNVGSGAYWEGVESDAKSFSTKVEGKIVVDNYLALRAAVESGLGIGLAGRFLFAEKGRLRKGLSQVLAHIEFNSQPVHLVFREKKNLPARIRLFVDFILNDLREQDWAVNL